MHALPTLLIIDFIRLALDVLVCSTIFLLKFPCDILYYFSLKVELCPQILFLLHLVFIFMYGCHKMGYMHEFFMVLAEVSRIHSHRYLKIQCLKM